MTVRPISTFPFTPSTKLPIAVPDMARWATSVQAAVTAIRKAGATTQHILLPGNKILLLVQSHTDPYKAMATPAQLALPLAPDLLFPK